MKYIQRDGMTDSELREYRKKVISGEAEPNMVPFEDLLPELLEFIQELKNESQTKEQAS